VNRHDPNLAKIELIANVLGPLRERLVFVGGCAAGLLLTDPAAAPARVTYDVDLTVQVAALADYHRLEDEFRALGFTRDLDMEVICRWRYRDLEVDLMPTDPAILGFANRWYPLVVKTAQSVRLPAGFDIRLITAPAFLATKHTPMMQQYLALKANIRTPCCSTGWAISTSCSSRMPRRRRACSTSR
jgi:predicted nucleotidyltransferase